MVIIKNNTNNEFINTYIINPHLQTLNTARLQTLECSGYFTTISLMSLPLNFYLV